MLCTHDEDTLRCAPESGSGRFGLRWGHLLPGGNLLLEHTRRREDSRGGCLHTRARPGFVFFLTVWTAPSGLALGPGTVTLQT